MGTDEAASLAEDLELYEPPPGFVACWSLGGMGFALKGAGTVVLLDPFLNPAYRDQWVTRAIPPPLGPSDLRHVDLVLASHEHPDHCDPVAMQAVADRTQAVVGAPPSACDVARAAGVQADRVRQLEPGSDVRVRNALVSAYASGDRLALSALVYRIQIDGVRFVHTGDSLLTDAFGALGRAGGVDVALVASAHNPPGEQWYLQPPELVEAARRMQAALLVPGHWDIWHELAWSPDELLAKVHATGAHLPTVVLGAGTRLLVGRRTTGAALTWTVAGPHSELAGR